MKKRSVLLLITVGLMLTACGNTKETADITPIQTEEAATQGKSQEATTSPAPQETENLPASQEYVSSDGTYKVILLEDLTQTDMQISADAVMMGLDGGSERTGFSGVAVRCAKSNIPGNAGVVEGLDDFADYMTELSLNGSGVTVNWEDTDAPSVEGAEQCLAREGTAKVGISQGLAYSYHIETEDSYFSVIIVGNDDDIEEAKKILTIEVMDETYGERGTEDFINAMTAALDSVNGANLRTSFKALADMGADESDLEPFASQAKLSLSTSWGIGNADELVEMADWLMEEGHNQDALQLLDSYGGLDETDRDAFDEKLKQQNLDDGTYISLLAAYDAWSAYGDGAIAAWDLSRVGTIMSFGYACGYCTYEDAMDKMLEAAQKSQELYDSWEDFNQSYLYGYSYWSEESLSDPESSAAERAELLDKMESQTNGPFDMDWNIELKKEW